MKMKYLIPTFFGCLISLSVMAQVNNASEEQSLSEEVPTTALVEILTAPLQIVPLPDQAVEIDMSLLNVPSGAKDLAEGVTAKGYARSVEVEGQKIGQVVLVGVAKGDKSEPLDSQTFSAQFEMKDDNIQPDQPITIMGDGQQLIEALKRLQEEPAPEEEEEQTVQTPEPNSTSQGENGNSQAAGYTSPDPIEKKEEGATEIKYTTSGCGVRVDEGKLQAIQQTMAQTYKGGALESESACMDGDTVFALEKSYKNCAGQDVVDLKATPPTATAQFQYYYVNTILGTNQTHGECQPDEEMVFNIVEKHGGCMISLDYTPSAEKAVFQSQLVYMNNNNVETQIRGCEASLEKPAVPLVRTTSGCNLRHDYEANKSFRQAKWTYQDNGTTYQAGSCQDDGTEYEHVKTYKDDAGKYLCTPIQNGNQITLQSRMKINVDGLSQFVTECTPDTSTLAVKTTTDGCTNPANWTHDLGAGQSYGQERFFFLHEGQEVRLGECQTSTETYAHQVETVDWENHDDQLFSYPKSTVYIEAPNGRYNIKTGEVLIGAQQMPYEFDRFDIAASEAPSYEGCNKTQPYNNVKVWKRPSGSYHQEKIGEGTPTTSNACTTTGGELTDWTESKNKVVNSCYYDYTDGVQKAMGYSYRECFYSTDITTQRDDGSTINTAHFEEKSNQVQNGPAHIITWMGASSQPCSYWGTGGATPPACPAHPTATEHSIWKSKYGF